MRGRPLVGAGVPMNCDSGDVSQDQLTQEEFRVQPHELSMPGEEAAAERVGIALWYMSVTRIRRVVMLGRMKWRPCPECPALV